MEETNGDRGDAGFSDRGDRLTERALIERRQDFTIRPQPLAHTEAQFARHQRFRRRCAQVVAIALQSFAHFNDVAMALRGQERDPGPLALEQRIGRDRGAVNEPLCLSQHLRTGKTEPARELLKSRHHADRLVLRR